MASVLLFRATYAETHRDTTSYEYTWAPVVSRDDPYTFTILVPKNVKEPSGPKEELTITSCQDLMPTSEIQAGVMLKWIAYEEDRAHHCSELDGSKFGYSLERRNHVPVMHDFSQLAGPRATRPEASAAETERPIEASAARP